MRVTPERLRMGIVALAVLLACAIAGSFLYGRWRLSHLPQDLPPRLGLKIKQSTQGFVLSKTDQGRPVFTLHAARALQYRSDGHYALQDVKIDLYNRRDNQADTIAGKDFEYDPRHQIVEARGEANLVLHAPPTSEPGKAGSREPGQQLRVTTHDLVFHQETGIATCHGEVEFELGNWSGHATGAQYDSKQGKLVLSSDLVIRSQVPGHSAVELKAARAFYGKSGNRIQLWQPRYRSGAGNGGMQAVAGIATILLRSSGSAESLHAKDNVRLVLPNGLRIQAPAMQVRLNPNDRPQQAELSGGVTFQGSQPARNSSGTAQRVEIAFNADGRAHTMILDGDVQLDQRLGQKKNSLSRSLRAHRAVLHFHSLRTGQPQLRLAEATGDAVFTSESASSGHTPQKTLLAAQTLTARFADGRSAPGGAGAAQLQRVDGTGQTRIETVAANGDLDSSTGDTLQVLFAPTSTGANGKHSPGESAIRMATQTGHVVLTQTGKPQEAGATPPVLATMTADRARYTAANHSVILTGQPRFRNDQAEISADRIAVDRLAGKAILTGSVQATLQSEGQPPGRRSPTSSSGSTQPVHVIATRAVLLNSTKSALFSGGARLWRGDDAIEAPVIEISQKMKTLQASGPTPCTKCVVASLSTAGGGFPLPAGHGQPAESAPTTIRILSHNLLYSDAERKASFLHHVQVDASNGELIADRVEIFLADASRKGPASNVRRQALPATGPDSVEKMIATGNVQLLQPERRATGSRLVYTAADGDFVLTGEPANPPQVVDGSQGTVTGEKLVFDSRSRAIMVSGSHGHRTTTKTRTHTE